MAIAQQGGGSPVQLNRTLERVLEEARATGHLTLSGRKLKEYPDMMKVDLSDLQSVDLSNNRLMELPAHLCRSGRLEIADFSNNAFRLIPHDVVDLIFLRILNLNRNLLFTIPSYICQLRQLQILTVCSNKLVSIPDEIGSLDGLQELDVSCNELDRLPPGVTGLTSLRRLNARRNNLVELPDGLGGLRLVSLDVSSNRIHRLPLDLRLLKPSLQFLALDHNPLELPPAHVCRRGRMHVFKFLEKEQQRLKLERDVINADAELARAGGPLASLYNASKQVKKSNSFGSGVNGPRGLRKPVSATERHSPPKTHKPKQRSLTVANGNVFRDVAEQHQRLMMQETQTGGAKAGTRDSGYHGAVDTESWTSVAATTSDVPIGVGSGSSSDGAGMNSSGTLTPASPSTITPPAIRHFINPDDGGAPSQKNGNPFEGFSPPRELPNLHDEVFKVLSQFPEQRQRQRLSSEPSPPTRDSAPALGSSQPPRPNATSSPAVPQHHQSTFAIHTSSPASPASPVAISSPISGAPDIQRSEIHFSPVVVPLPASSRSDGSNPSTRKSEKQLPSLPSNSRGSPAEPERPEREKTVVRIPIAEMERPTMMQTTGNPQSTRGNKSVDVNYRRTANQIAGSTSRRATASSSSNAAGAKSGTDSSSKIPPSRIPAFPSGKSSSSGSSSASSSSKTKVVNRASVSAPGDDRNNNNRQGSGASASRANSYRSSNGGADDSTNPNFTIRREEQRLRDEIHAIRGLRSNLESRLKIKLPDSPGDLAKALADGVILCHLVNHLRPRAVPTIHVPSASAPKLSTAKSRRNVENFLEACRKLGLPREDLPAPMLVLEAKAPAEVAKAAEALLRCASSRRTSGGKGSTTPSPARDLESDLTTVTRV